MLLGFVKKKTSDGKTRRIDCSERKSLSGYSTQVTEEDVAGVVSQWTGVPLRAREERKRTIDGIRNHFTSTGRWPK